MDLFLAIEQKGTDMAIVHDEESGWQCTECKSIRADICSQKHLINNLDTELKETQRQHTEDIQTMHDRIGKRVESIWFRWIIGILITTVLIVCGALWRGQVAMIQQITVIATKLDAATATLSKIDLQMPTMANDILKLKENQTALDEDLKIQRPHIFK
jgi:cytoskeletal protein RodZ